ncbi:MAG: hypothetical protein HQL13_02400, partial [Candidatus Omnitrophica bacterium]|nr:hypothetical protein [Candidatus Omnitrophota bacterium]
MVNAELQKIRERLVKINEKIKNYSVQGQTTQSSSSEEEYKPQTHTLNQKIPIEDMRAKLRAINDYIRDRAMGKDVKPPVFLKSEPVLEEAAEKLSFVMEHEPVEQIGEETTPVQSKEEEEKTTLVLPVMAARTDKKNAIRTGVGLDLGTAYIVASREVEDKRVFVKNERNAFLSVRCDQSTKDLLSKLKIKYVALQDKLYVLGGMALELADIFGRETQRSMNMGILNPSEAESIPIIQLLVKNILWTPRTEGEICCFSVPANPIDRDQDTIYHRGVFEGILRNIGFKPLVIDEGYAVVLSEMED